jgi:hypothetical protein
MTITDVDINTPALVGSDTAPAGGWKPDDGENKEGDRVSGKFICTMQCAISNSGAY